MERIHSVLENLPHTEDGRLFTLMPMEELPLDITKELSERGHFLNKKSLDWQTKELCEVSLIEVVTNLLTWNFVVEIEGHKYDVKFMRNEENGRLSFGWSSAPSPHLCSFDFIEKAFREGKWYRAFGKKKKNS